MGFDCLEAVNDTGKPPKREPHFFVFSVLFLSRSFGRERWHECKWKTGLGLSAHTGYLNVKVSFFIYCENLSFDSRGLTFLMVVV